jgi:hypothetical protein
MTSHDTERLIFEVLDGSTDPDQCKRLADLIAADDAVLALYCRCCEVDSALHRIAKGRSGLTSAATLDTPAMIDRKRTRTAVIAAIAAVFLMGVMLWLFGVPADDPVARLATSPDARYSTLHGGQHAPPGDNLMTGSTTRLSQGRAELTFRNGVRTVIEAPAEWTMVDDSRLDLRRGSAWVEVPPLATGFQVFTPNLEITDLGTEFGVLVEEDRHDEVHVFSGVVEARRRASAETPRRVRLTAGSAAAATPLPLLELIPARPERFASSLPPALPYLRWDFSANHPDGWPATGPHPGVTDATARPNGPLERPGDGPGAPAIRLAAGQRLETGWLGISGSRARSIAGWIRVPAEVADAEMPASIVYWGRESDSLSMMKWRVGLNLDLQREGGVKGALRTEFGNGHLIGTTDLRDGKWHHIASVYLGGNTADNTRRILHFVNGVPEPASSARHRWIDTASHTPLQFGGRLGRLDLADFIVVEGVLSGEQIAALARREPLPSADRQAETR